MKLLVAFLLTLGLTTTMGSFAFSTNFEVCNSVVGYTPGSPAFEKQHAEFSRQISSLGSDGDKKYDGRLCGEYGPQFRAFKGQNPNDCASTVRGAAVIMYLNALDKANFLLEKAKAKNPYSPVTIDDVRENYKTACNAALEVDVLYNFLVQTYATIDTTTKNLIFKTKPTDFRGATDAAASKARNLTQSGGVFDRIWQLIP